MKRITIAMLLMLAGCQLAAAATDDSTAARELYNRYASRRGYTATVKHSQGVSLVWITAKNDAKWKALKEELQPTVSEIPDIVVEEHKDGNTLTTTTSRSMSVMRMANDSADFAATVQEIREMLPEGILPADVKYDSMIVVQKTTKYKDGELVSEETDVKTDDQVKCDRSKLLKNDFVKSMAKHVGTGNITVANDDERTLCVCFYASGEDLLSLVFLAVAILK